MQRIMSDYAYGDAPRAECFWGPPTVDPAQMAPARGDQRVEVAVVGAGFTGLNAGLALAEAGKSVAIFDAQSPGWGASARNGGFCCLGGTKLPFAAIRRLTGEDGLRDWCATEMAAVDHVRDLLKCHGIDAQTHSHGETIMAHNARSMAGLRRDQAEVDAAYGFTTQLIEAEELPQHGMRGPFHGAMTLPHGFALNPRAYVDGLTTATLAAGARIYTGSAIQSVKRNGGIFTLKTNQPTIRADQVVFATNGYSSEDVPDWMRARFMPLQSSIIVTRPLSDEEIATGWSSAQMAYTDQVLLHYFRLLPDRRFLFGMRGGFRATPASDAQLRKRIRRQFEGAFPFWSHVETEHSWNGMLAFSSKLAPYVGPVPELPGAFTGFAYHGNGVAMGSYAGRLLADFVLQDAPDRPYPALMRSAPKRFPLGRHRRWLMAPGYAWAALTGG